MTVLAVNGSARHNGNTSILLRTVCDELEKAGIETEVIEPAGQVIEPCRACWACGGMNNMRNLGQNLAFLLKAVNSDEK